MHLTVFVIDDDQAARESLTFLLRTEGITARGYGSAAAFLAQLLPDHQGCIVTDVRMPEMDGIALVRHLARIGNRMPIVVITGHADIPLAVEAMRAGVADFIEKPFESDTILRAVRRSLEQAESAGLMQNERVTIERRMALLTQREREVCDAVVQGNSNKEIALALGISPRTVEIHRANVMSKMQADSLSGLVRMFLTSQAA
jgi:two-component system, LuxR family, response regulator FixJ